LVRISKLVVSPPYFRYALPETGIEPLDPQQVISIVNLSTEIEFPNNLIQPYLLKYFSPQRHKVHKVFEVNQKILFFVTFVVLLLSFSTRWNGN